MEFEVVRPAEIEARSFEIIGQELGDRKLDPRYEHIIKRCIHTSADFDYADTLYFSDDAASRIGEAIRAGGVIVTDTTMVRAGINKRRLARFGAEAVCYIGDPDVAEEAKARGLTRSYISMEKASRLDRPAVFAIGNAPTALVSICQLREAGVLDPAAVIGVPVGFVNVVQSKELLMDSDIPCIVNRGRKGGSNIAACVVNAILYKL